MFDALTALLSILSSFFLSPSILITHPTLPHITVRPGRLFSFSITTNSTTTELTAHGLADLVSGLEERGYSISTNARIEAEVAGLSAFGLTEGDLTDEQIEDAFCWCANGGTAEDYGALLNWQAAA